MAEARAAAPPPLASNGGAKPQLPEMEPSFAPGGEGVDVSIAAVPGFQGLMDVQRALVTLPQVASAAVRRYQDEEAAIQLILRQPMTATQIAEAVSGATGKQLIVDDARPEQLRLRLRFLSKWERSQSHPRRKRRGVGDCPALPCNGLALCSHFGRWWGAANDMGKSSIATPSCRCGIFGQVFTVTWIGVSFGLYMLVAHRTVFDGDCVKQARPILGSRSPSDQRHRKARGTHGKAKTSLE